jgi:glucan phosphoethanolaminetransferase (alkaline phosphatase superfamily)
MRRDGIWRRAIGYLALLAILSLLAGVLINEHVIGADWRAASGVAAKARAVALPCALTLTWLAALAGSRLTAFTLLPAGVLVGALYAYYTRHISLVICPHLFADIAQTDPGEVSQLINPSVVTYVLVVVAACLLAGIALHWRRGVRAWRYGVAILGAGAFLLTTRRATPEIGRYFPFNVQKGFVEYQQIRKETYTKLRNKTDISKTGSFTREPGWGDGLAVVLVIGESARSDHFSLNGYGVTTNPELSTIPGVTSFPNAWSCSYSTSISVPCLMTRATAENPYLADSETSFISVFRRLGFDTAWVSGEQKPFEMFAPINAIAFESRRVFFHDEARATNERLGIKDVSSDVDGYHWPTVLQTLRETEGRGPSLTVVHTFGSHPNYFMHHPRDFTRFVPECREYMDNVKNCPLEHLRNAYDNTILYTDHLLAEVIHALEGRDAILFYASDHGQYLGDLGQFLHGNTLDARYNMLPEMRNVPLVVWTSDKFNAHSPESAANIVANRERRVSHDHLFHSILDCAGIRSPMIDRTMSLCARDVREAGPLPPIR